ncbi:M24 family metallopeptidase [Parageobacillus thermoglucosidasius]|uniref:M24 family metallopeptidase n=1 Tax=Parageobacillus thermoglucosidasius TaxID=1426 RepID=UPI0001D172E0|nr:Xaa-Pro peptidase family protein [Parageobacillus thermoglucosidasius]AEH47261.1 peptidase M24 [Parageobacillus thermoglucosidasius C56-YS93]MED4905186.1 Xaa-Pro peptidase family protein [Parageobacillus thermoglucosidasius]MED4913411.1 Xaa-Pro peptidase family protein [Parageobacillus thermoglucosidasius]MED4944550.1 Xaa-Pro peptidase family protein [Parageobacillus thermoglucosidasius]MED4984599.1 Xaa-Pro peptidase family protein [Parageobacillus thermoglucosidasius]
MGKLEKLRALFAEYDIDGMLVTNPYNRRYITGFTGTAGVAVISQDKAVFITDFRYIEQASKQVQGFEIVKHTGPIVEEVAKQVARLHIQKLGFEQEDVSYATFKAYEQAVNAELVPTSFVVEKLRLIKSESEIKILKEAAAIADAAFEHILSFIRPGVKEIEVANELEFFMRKQGATSSSFDTIVASGYRSALPHGVATDKVIEKGELVTLDFGAYYNGYCSDITRTVAVGEISDELKTIYNIVLEAQLRGMKGIKPGMTGKEADALTRDYITEKGYGDYFGHSTGHGIGLEIHEGPTLSARSDVVLAPGMVVTVEPGIYIPGLGGVRIEDDTVVTENGNEALTHSPKELIIL